MKLKRLVIPALLSTLLLAASAQAHHVWLQQDAKSAHLYFGEFGENLRETSPGLLDRFVQPSAVLLGANGDKTLDVNKGKNAYALKKRTIPSSSARPAKPWRAPCGLRPRAWSPASPNRRRA